MFPFFILIESISGLSLNVCIMNYSIGKKIPDIDLLFVKTFLYILWKDIKEITISKWNLLDLFIVFQSLIGFMLVHSSISTPVFQSFSLLLISGVDSFIVLY